jgi:hypothetical protein
MIRTVFLWFCLFLFSTPALAQNHGPAIEKLFTDHLTRQKAEMQGSGTEMRLDGAVKVEPKGKFYSATLPHISFHKQDGAYTDVGIVTANVSPGKDKGIWTMTLAIPTPIRVYGPDKTLRSTIQIGKQSLNGVWYESLNGFGKMDVQYQDITIDNHAQGILVTVPKLTALIDSKQEKTLWSGKYRYGLENITIQKKGDPGTSKIGLIVWEGRAAALDIAHAVMGTTPLKALTAIKGPYGSSLRLENISLQRPAIPGSPPGLLNLKSLSLDSTGSGADWSMADMTLTLRYDGLEFQPISPAFKDLLPTSLNLDFSLEKMPIQKIAAQLDSVMKISNASPDIGALMAEAGTKLRLKDSHARSPLYQLNASGVAGLNKNNPANAEGNVLFRFIDMDNFVKALQARMMDKTVTEAERRQLAQPTVILTALQIFGKQEKTPDGKDVRVYDLSVDGQGQTLLNGQNLEAIKALMPKSKSASPQQVP